MGYDYTRPHFAPVPEGWSGTRLEAVVISQEVELRYDGGGSTVYAFDGGSRDGEGFTDLDEAMECFRCECTDYSCASSVREYSQLISIAVDEVEYRDGEIWQEEDACIRNESRVYIVGPHGAQELQGEHWPAREFDEAVQAWEAHHAPRCWIPGAGQCCADELPEAFIMRPDVWAALLAHCEGEGIYTRDVAEGADLTARRQFCAEVIFTLDEDLDFDEILAGDEA